jgi:prepilin-type N-terminal cleavage/methylation domain-containing protein
VKSAKGFTVVELLVVVAIIGIFLIMAWGPMVGWLGHFRFEAAGRSFINAAHGVRMQAIGGLPVLRVSSAPSITKSSDTKFTVKLDTITFTCNNCGSPPGSTPTKAEIPIKADDYVALTGFNSPDYFNGNLFRVIQVTADNPSAATPDKDKWGHSQWKATNVSFDCESCDEADPPNCLKWPNPGPSSYSLTTGKVQVAACLKFIQNTSLSRVPYSVIKSKTGGTIECYYDPNHYEVDINGTVVNPSRAIVFDFAGATRNHVEYLVQIREKRKGVVLTGAPALSFIIDRTGRIKLGM